jgi:hypothetical protein
MSVSENLQESPLITSDSATSLENTPLTARGGKASYTYLLAIIVVILVVFLIYHAYSCFCNNQELEFSEPYINGSPRTDTPADNSFDVDDEVKKLIEMQETFLEELQNSRMENS